MFALKSLKSLQQIFFRNNRSVHISLRELSFKTWSLIISNGQECWGLIPQRTVASSGTPPAPCAPSSPPRSSTAPGFSRSIASVKMVIWGQVRWINEKLIFWLLGNLSLKFTIFLLQQTDRGLAKKADYKEAFQDGELSPSARLLIVYCQRLKPGDLLSQGEAAAHLHVHVPPFIRPD